MPTEKICAEPKANASSRLLGAIEKVRLQKQRPSVERIHRVLRQLDPDVSAADVSLQLEKAAKDGIILKVVTNNLCSYKLPPSSSSSSSAGSGAKQPRSSLPVLKVLPSQEFFDTVVSLVNCLESCLLETLEGQLRRKYALEMTGDLSLGQELHNCCRKLVKIGRLQKDGQFFCLSSKGSSIHDADSVSESAVWKNPTICLEDCASQKTSTTIERFKEKGKQKESNNIEINREKVPETDVEEPADDLFSFPLDPVKQSPLKRRQRGVRSMWLKSGTREQTSPRKNPTEKSKGSNFSDPGGDFDCGVDSKGSGELATCDSTTASHAAGHVAPAFRRSSSERAKDDDGDTGAENQSEEEEEEEKPKKRSRSLQLAFLYDSLSKFFTASGEKRSAVQRSSLASSLDDPVVRSAPHAGSMALRAAAVPKASYDDRWHSTEERRWKKTSATLKPSEKSKPVHTKVKKPTKELCLKQGHSQVKSTGGGGGGGGGAGEVFTTPLVDDDSSLFRIAQTIAQERLLVTRGNQLRSRTRVIFGKYELESSQQIPYLPEYSALPRIYVCEFCLRCFKTKSMLERHLQKCCACHPPGEELYRDSSLSVFEVHGNKEPVYCRHLILFSRLFLDHPGLYCRVSQAIYYVTTISDRSGCHLVGFYSKEKLGEHNLACLLVLPQHRGKGFGHFMVHLSYWLSSTDETPKYPKPPLTDTAKWIYHSVWKRAITRCIEHEDLTEITVRVVGCLTGIRDEDVRTMLCELGLMCEDDPRHRVIALTPALREILQIKAEEKTRPTEFNPNAFLDSRLTRKLRGKPHAVKRDTGRQQSNVNPTSAKRQRHAESGKASDGRPEIPSRWKTLDDFGANMLSSKRRVGWPKGLKRGPKKEKVTSVGHQGVRSPENKTVEAKETSTDALGAKDKLDFESLQEDGRSLELEGMDVPTSARISTYRESSISPFEGNEHQELLTDHEGSIIYEMPQLDEKGEALQNSDNELEFGRSPSPPQLEQELPSPYFCAGGYMRHGLDMGSKDAESVLSDCLAGRSVAPSPCFSMDEELQPKSDKRVADDGSDSDTSATYNNRQSDYKGRSSQPRRSVVSRSPTDGVGLAPSKASDSADSGDENSLSSTGFSRSSSMDLQTFVKDKPSPLDPSGFAKDKLFSVESPTSNEDKLSLVQSSDSVGGKLSSLSSPDSNKGRSSPVGSPVSLKEKSPVAESSVSVKDKLPSVTSPSSPRAKSLPAAPSLETANGESLETKKREEEPKAEDGTRGSAEQSPSDGDKRSENESQSDPGEEDLPCDRSPVVCLPPSSAPCYSETEALKDRSGERLEPVSNVESILRESILPPVNSPMQAVMEQFVNETSIAMRSSKEVPDAFCGSFSNRSPASSVSASQHGQMSMASLSSASGHSYTANGHGSVTSPPMSHNAQMANSAMSRYENSEAGRLALARQQSCHLSMSKVGAMSENNLELSPAVTLPTARTFSEPFAPQSALMEAMSPHSYHLQNGLPTRPPKSGNSVPGSFSHCNDHSSILSPNSHGANVSRQAMSANAAAMAGARSGPAALSPGYMNSMIPSPAAKGMANNNYGQSKSSAMMAAGRSNAGRPNSSQVAAATAATAGNFGHQQMSKQILSNKYQKAMATNIQLQNLSSCGLYGLPKSSPSAGVPQAISNSSPNVNYLAVPNLSPGNSDCSNAPFHSLAGHNRGLVNASPAPSCSGKQYARSLQQHGAASRGFNTGGGGGGGGALSPSPKQSGVDSIYQLQPSQNSAHQIQAPAPYMHSAVQRHMGEQFPSGPESFSRQQEYMFQATYLAKLQQLTNDLGPFQAHYAMALPPNMSPSPIDMTLPSHASPQRNMTPPNLPASRHAGAKQQIHRGSGGNAQHKGAPAASSTSAAPGGFLPDMPGSSSDMIARYQLLSGYHVQQPMTCPSFIHQGSPSQIPMQVGVMNVGMHPGQPSPNFMPGVQGQSNSAVYAAYGYINGGLAPQPFNMHLNDLMRR